MPTVHEMHDQGENSLTFKYITLLRRIGEISSVVNWFDLILFSFMLVQRNDRGMHVYLLFLTPVATLAPSVNRLLFTIPTPLHSKTL